MSINVGSNQEHRFRKSVKTENAEIHQIFPFDSQNYSEFHK